MPFGGWLTLGVAAAGTAGALASSGNASGGSQRLGLVNPGSRTLGDLFGTRFTRKGGFIRQGDPNAPFASSQILPAISQYAYNPLLGTQSDLAGLRNLFQTPGFGITDIVGRGMEGFRGLSDLSLEGAATGWETDASPIYNEAIRRFGADILPQIAETSGLGLQSSGFEALAGREAAGLLGQASEQQVALREAAAQRRMGLLPIAGQLQAAEAAFPINVSRDVEEGARRPLDIFLALMGQGNQTQLLQQGYPTQDSTTDLLGSLGSLASLYSSFNKPATPTA